MFEHARVRLVYRDTFMRQSKNPKRWVVALGGMSFRNIGTATDKN
jgi:hypothetical protein